MLALALLALAADVTLEWRVRAADPIALVRIERVHVLSQENPLDARSWPSGEVRIAEATVERRILGRPERTRLHFALRRPGPKEREVELEVGDRALVFLHSQMQAYWRRAGDSLRQQLEGLAPPSGPQMPLAGGIWKVTEDGRARVPERLDLPAALEARAGTVRLDALLAWVDGEVERTTPALEAHLATTGPAPWGVVLEADGSFHGNAAGCLSPSELDRLWSGLAALRFRDLPEHCGTGNGPCATFYLLRTRERDGGHEVRIFLPPEPLGDPVKQDALDRALRAWQLLPLPGRPDPR